MVGNTEIGIEMKYGRKTYPIFIAATHIPELSVLEVGLKRLERWQFHVSSIIVI